MGTPTAGRMAGRVAVVTGVGSGIGQGIALRYAAEGAQVIAVDINEAAAAVTADRAAQAGHPFAAVLTRDLTDEAQVCGLVEQIARDHDRVDTLVNAGAIQPHMASTADMDYDTQFRPTIVGEIDLVFLLCSELWPLLQASGRGSIINFASVNSYRGSRAMGMVAHCAGKGAVLSMSRQMAVEGGPDQIRVNTIAPGMVATDATRAAGASTGDMGAAIAAKTLLGRIGSPDDIAMCALWLGSDESGWVTGANVCVDGGVTAA